MILCIRSKLPTRQEILPVFSSLAFIFFSWTLYRMFYQAPSWLYYLGAWDVLILAAYVLAFALFESLAALGFITLLCVLLPARRLKDQFAIQGSTAALLIGVGAVALQRKIGLIYKLELWQMLIYPLLALALLVILVLAASYAYERFRPLARLASALAERMTVFAYLYTPLGLLALVVVLLRNLF
ncbi:MAG: hypothetical protein JXA78_17665 [Anaerolineales bacterium]|nr:hypothetical protein [Anaerolineales bacterium]